MNKSFKSYAIIWGIVLAIYTVVAFVIPKFGNSGSFYINYIFVLIAFVAQLGTSYFSFKKDNLNKLFLNIPTIIISNIMFVCVTIIGIVCIVIQNMPIIITAILCFVVIAIGVIAILTAKTGADIIEKIDDEIKVKVSFIKNLQADVELLEAQETDKDIKGLLQKLAEDIRYSDPMSNEALVPIETEISDRIKALKYSENKNSSIKDIQCLLEERNKKTKILK